MNNSTRSELFKVISKWSGFNITNKCCKNIPIVVVKYNDDKTWLLCSEDFKKLKFRKNIAEILPIENPSEFGLI